MIRKKIIYQVGDIPWWLLVNKQIHANELVSLLKKTVLVFPIY